MDISDFIPKTDTVDIEIVNPMDMDQVLTNKDGSPMVITMYLPHSKVYKEVRHDQTNKRIRKAQKKGNNITAEDIEEETLDLLVRTTASWNISYKEKQYKDFDTQVAKEIYREAYWISDQLFKGVEEAEVFTKN